MDPLCEFELLINWERNGMIGKIPEEADINMGRKEAWVTLLLVPGDAKGRDP